MEHRIITEGALPVKQKVRRIPAAWEDEVNTQVTEMLKNDIIRPSVSPWNSLLLLVQKKDNTMRFMCDFRGLNNVTKKDTYPLPHVRDVLDKMHGAMYWSTLDAASAYWSLPLSEEDKEKTAFSITRGKYEFNVTPYGLSNAGASYQRMIDMCLAALPANRVLAYMDDVVVFSPNFEEHVKYLDTVFGCLREANISLKASKCMIAMCKVDFLGYELSGEGIRPQNQLTEAIKELYRPESKKELKSFLGLAGFYGHFIRDFAEISHPLCILTRDNVLFNWDTSCDEAFRKLKTRLLTKPLLAYPRVGEEFVVDVDASDNAFGGILMQLGNDSQYHPVGYFSDAVKPSQENWNTTTKEAFAVVLAVRHWYVYLMGTNFTLNMDHNPLVDLRLQKDPRGKFARWIIELEEFNYTIKYIPGIKNTKADTLSRNKAAKPTTQPLSDLEEKIYSVSISDTNFMQQLQEEQTKDPIISTAIKSTSSNEVITNRRLKRVQRNLQIENNILTKSGRPIIPAHLRNYVLSKIHNEAHFGTDKTYTSLKERFYWPNMYEYTRTFVTSCNVCQKVKCDTRPAKAPLLPMCVPEKPMNFISIDVAYMPKDNDGYQYVLLIGDIFSKLIQAVPMRDQTTQTIIKSFLNHWLYVHGSPSYLLSDQGSNVDGDTIQRFCTAFGIEKRRSTPYHSQGNGFAERNIRSIRDMLCAVLLDKKLNQCKWCQLLPGVVFALNCSESKATKCIPYQVVFGRKPTLPVDMLFNTLTKNKIDDVVTPRDYVEEIELTLKELFNLVIDHLHLSKARMLKQYNKNIRFHNYMDGEKAWLKVKHFRTGETRKLSPRCDGPWIVLRKMHNGVNFKIKNEKTSETKIVHHDRLFPIRN